MAKPVKTKPSQFFTVVLPATLEAKKLKIVDAFVEQYNGFPKHVVIQNKMGKLWPMIVGCIHNEVFFQHGWENFVEDNRVESGDFLVFNYDGDHKFDVMIFGRSACEKIESGASVGMDREVEMEEYDIVGSDVPSTEPDEEDSDESEYSEGEEEEEEEEDTEEEDAAPGGSKKGAAEKDGVREVANDVLAGADVRKYVQTTNPYFVVKMGKQRRYRVLVPNYVLRDFRLELAEEITFEDKLKRKWPGRVVRWKDGRTCIYGWRRVCQWNHVDEGDWCIYEFPITAGKKQDLILVHVTHGAGSRSQSRT